MAFVPPARSAPARGVSGAPSLLPTHLCYGSRIGIRSCAEQRYVAAFPRTPASSSSAPAGASTAADTFELEVSGFHPFRQGDAADRASECPSEWLLLQFNSHKHRGVVHLGDEVCFARELSSGGEKRKERYSYLALGPNSDNSAMEPAIERREVTDTCRWTLVHADGPEGASAGTPLQPGMPLLIRGKYNDCLALGRPLWDSGGGQGFRSPVRASGRCLVCKGRDGRVPELRFRIVRAGTPFGADPAPHPPLPGPSPPSALLGPEMDGEDFAKLSFHEQEKALLDDVLFCFLGVEGTYIRRIGAGTKAPSISGSPPPKSLPETRFEVEPPPGADASTVQFLRQLLPLCEHHAAVELFVSHQGQHQYGAVNHALCAALNDLLREFASKVGRLEQALRAGELSLAKLWYHAQPSIDTFALLHRVAAHVYGLMGGAVLNGIEEVMVKSSLTTAQDLCEFLLQQASRPYFEMVSKWVYEGCLEDPYGEFFVSENPRVRDERTGGPAADFWQKHFVLDERAVPQFLAASRERILHSGKYLHVYLSAAPAAKIPEPRGGRVPFRYSRRRRDYAEAIDAAFRRAAAALLGLFMKASPGGLDLPGRLMSMRSFFFLGKADWFGHLLDTASGELERPAEEVPLPRLDGLLDLAVRASSVAADPYREDITCGLHSFRIEDACHRMAKGHSLPSEDVEDDGGASVASVPSAAPAAPASLGPGLAGDGSGVRCLTLKYRTSWPLSIVFSRALLLKYQVIFRHLLYCRYVERKLVEVWVDHQYTKELGLDSSFSPYYSLRQRMLHFCRDYIYYVTVEVLEPQSHRFLSSLGQAETIDDVLRSHEQFLDTCLREVLLTERDSLYRHLSKVLQTCLTFAHNLRRFSQSIVGETKEEPEAGEAADEHLTPAERRLARVRQSTQTYLSLLSQRHYSKMMAKWKTIFESQLQGFLRQIQQESTARYEHFLSNLATRLDYNEYYSSVLSAAAPTPATA
eukprot:TRINITY_DN49018_c0_g1_i1.p1 TRINITY_DN49018_c0_g1~~TRINITY_DN49018_c0_g1_i1.p1  ORF type:complete len:979 (+),score=204.75 TRINITY_DN49018_c0_g1_i1:69-3005(+)